MNVNDEIQEVLSRIKADLLLEQHALPQGAVANPEDPRFRLRPISQLLQRARILQCLWSDPDFWKTLAKAGDDAAFEYLHGVYKLPKRELKSVKSLLKCELSKLPKNRDERQRFFAAILHLVDKEDALASRAWMRKSGTRVIPILKKYLSGPRFESKRYLLRNLSQEDLAELYILAGQLAEDTEHVATKELTIKLKRGNRKSVLYLEKTEWLVEQLLRDGAFFG